MLKIPKIRKKKKKLASALPCPCACVPFLFPFLSFFLSWGRFTLKIQKILKKMALTLPCPCACVLFSHFHSLASILRSHFHSARRESLARGFPPASGVLMCSQIQTCIDILFRVGDGG